MINTTFQQYLQSAFRSGPMSTDETVEFVLALFEEVNSFHENGQVGSFEKPDTIFLTAGRLDIDENYTHDPDNNLNELNALLAKEEITGYQITGQILVDQDVSQNTVTVKNMQVQTDNVSELHRPVYLPGYQCYEMKLKHHDAQTDIFCLGLILGSVVMGLDLYDVDDLNQFASYRQQPAGLNPRMHPTLCSLVTEMTELDRSKRLRDLNEAIQRLKFYRDYDPQLQTDLSLVADLQVQSPADRKSFILSKLRNRLFDSSRRNRMLYYKPNSRFANLTISSVPMVLHYQSINPQLLFTWNGEISKKIIATQDLELNRYLRFEDHPYLNSQLNSIRQQSESDKKEFGFSQLKLVVAYLHWHNLKEGTNERIQSPLLLLPVTLERRKSLKEERFVLKILDNAAVINPVLNNHLKDLYGIELPESIDFDDISMEGFYNVLQSKINEARQGVKLNYIDKPRIKIIHNIAKQTINNYQKKLRSGNRAAFSQIEYSYSEDNFKPLGLELFKQKIQPVLTNLEFLLTSENATDQHLSNLAAVKSTFEITEGENNPYSWDFDICNIVLGNFNYKKMSLVGDYNTILQDNIYHNVFENIFSNKPRNHKPVTVSNNIKDWHHVIAADPTQNSAVAQSRSGESYVIQGPPGTGKSQTITNLIADLLVKDKNILFICEKRAALDVVYHRLNQNKLGELCCYIHDSQGDKKEFYKNLKLVYDDFVNNRMNLSEIEERRKVVLLRIENHTALLNEFHRQLKSDIDGGVSIRYLMERLLALGQVVLPEMEDKSIVPGYGKWKEYGQVISELSKALGSSGADEALAHHPFANLNNHIIHSENPFTLFDNIVAHAYESLEMIKGLISQYNISGSYTDSLQHIRALIEDAVLLEPIAKSGNLNLTEPSGEAATRFEAAWQQYNQLYRRQEDAAENTANWVSKFSRQDVLQAIPISERYEKAFLGFLNSNWRRLKKRVNQSYNFSLHAVKPSYSSILKQLQDEYSAADAFASNKAEVEQRYRVEDIAQMKKNIDALRNKKGDREVDYLLAHEEPDELVIKLSKLNNELQQLELHLKQCLYSVENKSVAELRNELATIKSNAPVLRQLLPYLREFSALPLEVQNFIRKIPVTPAQAEAVMASCTLDTLYKNNQTFAATNYGLLQRAVGEIEAAYRELLMVNADYIRAKRRAKFLKHYELSNAAATPLSPDEKRFKKSYSEGRKVLEHEMNKTMRYRTIREIASNESGQVLKDVKPVWLMSPLSVSDSLPLDTNFFDVVIFDEASQITLEQGIPALFRAPQTIIVGDDKQMPPSNFFNAKAEDANDLDTFEGEKEDEIISADADSLLVQGARKLNNTMLSWHYRSRHEELISYSNHAFYEGGLLTIPDKKTRYQVSPLLEVKGTDDGKLNAGLLLKGGISYHYIPGAVYENRSNLTEAKYIAEMLRKLLLNEVGESIGIVAFSQEQQSIIETAIEELALTDRDFEMALDKAFNRNEDGQFTGVFIKNLENVQGDERDIIIMSVCYGFDANKKMLMNFGPINKKGGEKRLNVIFSRAKKHMAVVSSIRYHHISNDYNAGANYFKRFLHYAELVSTGDLGAAQMILDTLNTTESKKAATTNGYFLVAHQLKDLLQKKGFYVDENVGQSTFKCALAIKKNKEDEDYSLGILIDDEHHYNNENVIEQYYQKPSVLKAFGWRIVNIYAKDWLEDQELVMQRVLKLLNGEALNVPEMPRVEPSRLEIAAPIDENSIFLVAPEQEKFWQLTIEGNTITTKFGKTGTPGLSQVKIFDTEEQADAMRLEMIKAYKEKGYKEDTTGSTAT